MSLFRKQVLRASLACLAFGASGAMAADQVQINAAINNGLAYLANQQTSAGSWSYGGYDQAATGAAVFAMLSQQNMWGANAASYQADVDKGIQYLLNSASVITVSNRADGANICPAGSGSCTGVYWYGAGESTYTTGQVAMAIAEYAKGHANAVATTTGSLAGMTWKDIAQGVINTYSANQSTANSPYGANRDGGWRYYLYDTGYGDSDMSTTQWAVLASIYGQSLGATVPQTVRDHLKNWLAAVQAGNGSACYQPGNQPCESADTGGLLLSLKFVGTPVTAPAVQSALGFLNSQWSSTASGTWYGNFGQPYAMWAQYKALQLNLGLADTATILNLLDPTCGGNSPTSCNWWQDYNQWLVTHQNNDGSWSGTDYWTGVLATAYDLPILGGAQIPDNNKTPEPATIGLVAGALFLMSRARRATTEN